MEPITTTAITVIGYFAILKITTISIVVTRNLVKKIKSKKKK
jgi:hypothetical protein